MDTILISLIVQSIIAIIAFVTMVIIYRLNQRIILNEVVKQERELRIKLFDYKLVIENKKIPKDERKEFVLNHDTLLFNYYEYLAICLYKKMINESDGIKYFRSLLKDIRELFESSILFKEGYSNKEEYPGIQWLFKKWGIKNL